MPLKIVIVAVGVVLAILALSFFATGYDLGGKPLVWEEEYISGYRTTHSGYYLSTYHGETIELRGRHDEIVQYLPASKNRSYIKQIAEEEGGMVISTPYRDSDAVVYVHIPKKYLTKEPIYDTAYKKLYPGDFYLLSMLCLIGLSFLAMYAAFTSRKK